jgi:hypothetical protein
VRKGRLETGSHRHAEVNVVAGAAQWGGDGIFPRERAQPVEVRSCVAQAEVSLPENIRARGGGCRDAGAEQGPP